MKTIRDAVIELDGKAPERTFSERTPNNYYISTNCICLNGEVICHIPDFIEQAKSLGYINGYRWGVEYSTNGKRPYLPDDLLVDRNYGYRFEHGQAEVSSVDWLGCKSFKITDQRYKPADTGYLNIQPQDHIVESNEMVIEWWDYDKLQVKSGKLIPVGSEVLFFDRAPNPFKCKVMYSSEYVTVIRCIDGSVNNEMIGVDISRCPFEENFNQIKPFDWNRKAEIEREKVIEAAMKFCYDKNSVEEIIEYIYSAGMLALPPNKSDTKD